jgi:hypothetical protein
MMTRGTGNSNTLCFFESIVACRSFRRVPGCGTWGLAAGRNTRRNAGQKKRESQLSPCLTLSSRKLCMGASAFEITINSFLFRPITEKDCREKRILSLLTSKERFCHWACLLPESALRRP